MVGTTGLPEVTRTAAWSRRLLNTQLASWAELRHDTLLYAKRSYAESPVATFRMPSSMLVVTADTCQGPRAYTGLAFAYHEKITEDFDRFTDERWSEARRESSQPDVPWLTPVLAE